MSEPEDQGDSAEMVPSIVPMSLTQGEDHHKTGDESERKIIRWLRMTTRVSQFYKRDTELAKGLLVYKWPYTPNAFSFDFGGQFRGGDMNGQGFLAESKGHETSKNLPKEFRKFLAQCYVLAAYKIPPPSHFLWISFSPHGSDKWTSLTSPDEVRLAILHEDNLKRVFGSSDASAVKIDEDAVFRASQSIWVLIYSDRLEQLSMETEHFKLIQADIAEKATAL